MKNWPQVALGELCDIYQPKTITSAQILSSGPYKVYGANGVIGYFDKYNHENAEIAVTCRGATCGTINITEPRSWITGNAMVVNPKDGRILSKEFLFYILRATDFNRVITGAAQPQITRSSLAPFKISLPPLDTQKLIVSLLDQATDLKEKREKADVKMATFAPALFHQMFGDPAKNERGWEMRKLKDVARVSSGAGFPLQEQGNTIESHPFFKVGDMNSPENKIELVVAHNYVSESTAKKLKAEIFPTGSIAFPKIGAAIATDKKRILHQPSCVDNNVMVVIPKESIHPNYLFALFQTKRISDFSSSGTVPSIRKTTVEEWDIPIPPISIQKEYASQVAEFQLLAGKQNVLRNRLDELFNSLISSYL